MALAEYHVPSFSPVADDAAIVSGEQYRFTVLTPRIVRMEYDPDGDFEDRPTQTFWHRDQPVPDYEVTESDDHLVLETDELLVEYTPNEPFGPETLSATIHDQGTTWRYGDPDHANMGGTVRTLDRTEGPTSLEDGLLGGDGWTVVEDTDSLVFEADGWLANRDAAEDYEDVYLFGYGHDYLDCLKDFTEVAGDVPMIPRWALGNWWSRYEDYSAGDLRALMGRFKDESLPLSVCVLDMDWHTTENPYHGGWTGWSWNRDLFPNPAEFVNWLHDQGLRTTLNIHPAEGVYPHEDCYGALAEHMGIDPASETPIDFDASDAQFLRGYFDHVIDPIEDNEGVDFWWIDWQQWEDSPGLPGLDPLWALNHLHALDRTRDGRRPFILSRWGGLGGHRYPIGFSGDAFISWRSLAFQSYLTLTGSNVDFGWWSHDIGGHFGGSGSPRGFGELYARWTQFGALSPINRIHTGNIDYIDKRPWSFAPTIEESLRESLQFRHALIPYLYTMAWHNHDEGVPLVRPMYYHHADTELAYHCPQQYYFGSELLAAPYTEPRDDETNMARQTVWLPDTEWYDFHTGEARNPGLHARYGDLDDVPLYAKPGAIVPLDDDPKFGETEAPDTLQILVFPGDDNGFDLYEDDGVSQDYREGAYATTHLSTRWDESRLEFTVDPAERATEFVPETRDLELCFRGLHANVTATVDGETAEYDYRDRSSTVVVTVPDHSPDEPLTVTLSTSAPSLCREDGHRFERVQSVLRNLDCPARTKSRMEEYAAGFLHGEHDSLDWLANFSEVLTDAQVRAIVETLCDVGVSRLDNAEQQRLLLWNEAHREDITHRLSTFQRGGVPLNVEGASRSGPLPEREIIEVDDLSHEDWTLTVEYAGAGDVTYEGEGEAERYHGNIE